MKWFRLATSATLVGVLLASGCASPCGGCRGGVFQRMSMFRARGAYPCECCGDYGGGVPTVGVGPGISEGPLLEPPGSFDAAIPSAGIPPEGGPPAMVPPPMAPPSMVPPSMGTAVPGPLPPSLGAPLGTPAVPADPGRITPIPAQPFSAEPSSRTRRR